MCICREKVLNLHPALEARVQQLRNQERFAQLAEVAAFLRSLDYLEYIIGPFDGPMIVDWIRHSPEWYQAPVQERVEDDHPHNQDRRQSIPDSLPDLESRSSDSISDSESETSESIPDLESETSEEEFLFLVDDQIPILDLD